jgi:hypothetical protein
MFALDVFVKVDCLSNSTVSEKEGLSFCLIVRTILKQRREKERYRPERKLVVNNARNLLINIVRKKLDSTMRLMWGSAAARSAASSLPNTIQKLTGLQQHQSNPHLSPSTTQHGLQNREDACATTRKVIALVLIAHSADY